MSERSSGDSRELPWIVTVGSFALSNFLQRVFLSPLENVGVLQAISYPGWNAGVFDAVSTFGWLKLYTCGWEYRCLAALMYGTCVGSISVLLQPKTRVPSATVNTKIDTTLDSSGLMASERENDDSYSESDGETGERPLLRKWLNEHAIQQGVIKPVGFWLTFPLNRLGYLAVASMWLSRSIEQSASPVTWRQLNLRQSCIEGIWPSLLIAAEFWISEMAHALAGVPGQFIVSSAFWLHSIPITRVLIRQITSEFFWPEIANQPLPASVYRLYQSGGVGELFAGIWMRLVGDTAAMIVRVPIALFSTAVMTLALYSVLALMNNNEGSKKEDIEEELNALQSRRNILVGKRPYNERDDPYLDIVRRRGVLKDKSVQQ